MLAAAAMAATRYRLPAAGCGCCCAVLQCCPRGGRRPRPAPPAAACLLVLHCSRFAYESLMLLLLLTDGCLRPC
eukprot:COSAG01_NODE_1152_length_11492_cov_12.314842_8_plen_74_part_00